MDAQTALELFNKQLLTYDSKAPGNDMFYYSLPYERNYELTRSIPLDPVSGNVIKFYQYQMKKPVVIFTDIVDTTAEEADIDDEELLDGEYEDEGSIADQFYDEDGNLREDLTEEEMAALLTRDTSSEEGTEAAEDALDDSFDDDEVYDKEPASAAPSDDYDDYDDDEVYDKVPTGASAEAWDAPEF